MIKLKILFLILFFLVGLVALQHSEYINKKIFNWINPYDPLRIVDYQSNTPEPQKRWVDPRGLFPIFAYNLPNNTMNLEATLRIIEEGGINIIINGNLGWMPDPLKIKEAFKNLSNSKLKWIAIIENECKDDFIFGNTNDESNKNIKKYLDLFNEDYLYGWYVWDEPGKNRKFCSPFNLFPNNDFEDINTIVKQIREDPKYSSKLDFVNLFPSYWDGTKDINEYEKYLISFFTSQKHKPRVLCVDIYPFLKEEKGGFRQSYYSNLEIVRKKSIQWNIPFWVIVLSSGHDNYKNPSFEEISFQVYSALAYGAKGIGYYLYSKSFEQIGYRSWIFDKNLDKENLPDSSYGDLFAPIKTLNEHLLNIGEILLTAKSIGVFHSSDFPNNQKDFNKAIFDSDLRNNPIIKVESLGVSKKFPDLLVGFFNSSRFEKNEILMLVVNKNFQENCSAKLYFDKIYRIKKYDKESGSFEGNTNNNDTLTINLLPGMGELFLLK